MTQYKKNYLYFFFLCLFVSFNVKAQVTANFSGSVTSGCAPLLVQFTDLSTGSPTSWNWVFGNGNTSTNQNPSAIYTNPGTYTVTLTANASGSSDVETKLAYITVYAKPTADFTLSEDTTCVGQNILLTDASTINVGGAAITSWAWDYGDGNLQTVAIPTTNHTYSSVGLFPISVIVTDLNGCTGARTKNVLVRNFPNPTFTANPSRGCTAPLNVTFSNTTSTVSGSSFLWRFGDGTTSTSQNPTHTYTSSGNYNVTLIITQGGCSDSVAINNSVIISDIVASFNASTTTVCEGSSVTFTNSSAPASVNTSWTFGDGGTAATTNATYTYATAGTYTVTMNATDANGCSGSATNTITVNPFPIVNFTSNVTQGCSVPFAVNFTNTSTGGSTFNWNFGDGNTSTNQNPSHTYTAAGTYPVTLTVGNAGGTCSDSLRINNYITITPPVANFTTNPDSGCVSLDVTFTSSSTSVIDPITSYEWTFGDGNAGTTAVNTTTNTYATQGVFSPRLIVITALGCRDTFDCTNCIKTGTPPNANFTIVDNTICFGQLAEFNETATGETGYKWLFGDNGNSLLADPTHNYADTGTFQIQLVAFNNGCSDTSAIQTIRVDGPKASMTRTMSCTDYYDVIFNSTSVMADLVTWDFGDGTQDLTNTTSLTHVYATRGTKTITLIATNFTTGCADTVTANIRIAEPIAAFTTATSSGCYPFTATFNSSTSQDASTYSWDFGDPLTTSDVSTAANPSYTYNSPGASQVELIIRDVNGCRDTVRNPLATLGPLVGFESNILTGCSPLPVTFTDTSIVTSPIVSWTWDFGDGNTLTNLVNTATHTYTSPGNYAVTLTVTDNTGCTQSKTVNGFIQPTFPFPALAVDTFACANELVTFNASATNAVGEQYIWNFGDGTIDTTLTATTTHAYNADNIYTITLTVKDTNGCDSTITASIRVLKPDANFSMNVINSGCGTLQANFTDLSTGFVNAWQWNFGTGTTSSSQNPTFTWTNAGTFDISLIVTNTGGCKDTLIQTGLAVVPGPVGTYTFTPDSGCNPLTVTFNASSLNAENYFWDLADGTVVSGVDSLTYTYNFENTYHPILVLSTTMSGGTPCLLPATNLADSIQVINLIDLTLSNNSLTLIEDSTAIVNVTTTGGTSPYTYSWTPTDNMDCSTCADVTFTGDGNSEIKYYVTATDLNGCKGLDSVLVISTPCVNAETAPNYFSPNGDDINDVFYIPGVCAGDNYKFQIFNRWGNLMFTSSLRKQVWDGRTTSGMPAPDGTYYYILEVSGTTYKGFVQLTR